jgi:hypothetical protein
MDKTGEVSFLQLFSLCIILILFKGRLMRSVTSGKFFFSALSPIYSRMSCFKVKLGINHKFASTQMWNRAPCCITLYCENYSLRNSRGSSIKIGISLQVKTILLISRYFLMVHLHHSLLTKSHEEVTKQ